MHLTPHTSHCHPGNIICSNAPHTSHLTPVISTQGESVSLSCEVVVDSRFLSDVKIMWRLDRELIITSGNNNILPSPDPQC